MACSSLCLADVEPAGMPGQAGGSIFGMLNTSPLHARYMAGSWRRPRYPLLRPTDRNSHKVSEQFADDRLDLLMGELTEDTCEDGMRHWCLSAFGRNSFGGHYLGGRGRRSAKGRRLVSSNDDTGDAVEKGTGCSIPVLRVRSNVGNGHAVDNGNGAFNCRLGCKFKVDFHMGMH